MAIYKRDLVDINLETGNIHRSWLKHSIGYKDQKADHFGVRTYRDGTPVDLTGVSVQGVFLPPQGDPIAITSGNIVSGNVAEVVLPQACYNYDGQFTLAIKLVDSNNNVTGTVRIVDGMVDNTHASGTVAPTSAVPTYQEILSTYDAMIAATAAANGAIAATYSSSSTYAVGDYCIHDGGLYRCTTAITTGEAWTAAHWTAAKIGPDLATEAATRAAADSDLKSAFVQSDLLNHNALLEGYLLSYSTGEPVAMSGRYVSEYIPVIPGGYVYILRSISSTTYAHVAYDENLNIVQKYYANNDNLVMQMPLTAKYIRISGNMTYINDNAVHTSADFDIQYVCRALAKDGILYGTEMFDSSSVTEGKGIKISDGQQVSVTGAFVSGRIAVEPGDVLYLNHGYNSKTYGLVFYKIRESDGAYIYDSGMNIIGIYGGVTGGKYITIPNNIYAIRFTGLVSLKSSVSLKKLNLFSQIYRDRIIANQNELQEYENETSKYIDSENLFSTYTTGYVRNTTDGYISANENGYYSAYIEVEPLTFYRVEVGFNSSTYGHAFFNENGEFVSAVGAVGDYETTGFKVLYAPATAKYLSISGMTANVENQKVRKLNFQTTQKIASITSDIRNLNFYDRHAIKNTKRARVIDGVSYTHEAFPSATYFNGDIYICSRIGKDHVTPVDPSNWGGIIIDKISMDGKLTLSSKIYDKSDFTGLDGEIRDTSITCSKDGQYLICSSWTTYYDGQGNTKHDNIMFVLNDEMEVVTYNIEKNAEHIYWGNLLFDSDNHLMIMAYGGYKAMLVRSEQAFSSNISSMTFTKTEVFASDDKATESCIGIFNNKLVCLIRTDLNTQKTYYAETSDLTGQTGWTEAVSIGIPLHAPKVLPYSKGDYLFFGGAYLDHYTSGSDRLRYAVIGYIDPTTKQVRAYNGIDPTQEDYSGYMGFVPLGGDEYFIAYYQEATSHGTGLYYKRVNSRAVISQISQFM